MVAVAEDLQAPMMTMRLEPGQALCVGREELERLMWARDCGLKSVAIGYTVDRIPIVCMVDQAFDGREIVVLEDKPE